jgi:phosphotransferase system HPr (HPr) family protein
VKVLSNVTVKNSMGLHARPASIIAQMLKDVSCSVTFLLGEERANAKSIMGILMLAAGCGSTIAIEAEGPDAQEVIDRLVLMFDNEFEELVNG